MISNSTIANCKLERKQDITYLVTPEQCINCELAIPTEMIEYFEDRELSDTEMEVIMRLRDRDHYTSFDQPFKALPYLTFGKFIALFVARNNYCITLNEGEHPNDRCHGTTISVEYPWSTASNSLTSVDIGGVYDMVTLHGIATVIVIEKFDQEFFHTLYDEVKVFVLSDVMFPVTGTQHTIKQLSKVNVSSRSLIPKGGYFFN